MTINAWAANRNWGTLVVLLLGMLALPSLTMADDTEEVLLDRFSGKEAGASSLPARACTAASSPVPGEIVIDVPGTGCGGCLPVLVGIRATHGGGDDTVILIRNSDGASLTLVADAETGTYGPKFWIGGYYYYVYVAEVTSLIKPGQDTYAVSDFGGSMVRRDGAGVMVVYEDTNLPVRWVAMGRWPGPFLPGLGRRSPG